MTSTVSTLASVPDLPLGLDNCDREPIHIPGRIQSHGVLVVFDLAQQVSHRSANTDQVFGALAPQLGQTLETTCFAADPKMLELVHECFRADGGDVHPVALEVQLGGRQFEMIGHRMGNTVLIELELQQHDATSFPDDAFGGHRALSRLKRQRSIDDLLAAAVEEVRALTGFDRVMAYRFRHDDSGDVVAEARVAELEPLLRRRYPAGDIPAQARRLYTINTLRIIVDVASATVPVETMPGAAEPLDMSHSVLRSVSPVHIEYLGNMGVAASMSISVVINGNLWGMLACHHRQPRHVPYRVRSACDVLAHVLAANVQSLTVRAHAKRLEAAASVRARAIEGVLHADEGVFALLPQAQALCETFEAEALVLAEQGRIEAWGGVPVDAARSLVQWLDAGRSGGPAPLVAGHTLAAVPADVRNELGIWCGFIALHFGEITQGWVLMLRKEQEETIAWGGKPEKEYVHGPLGPRLTPRGSFDVWKETARGRSVPWDNTDLDIAQTLMSELIRANLARATALDRARSHLLTMLSEGIQSPTGEDRTALADEVADAAPSVAGSRMQRFVSQVLDAARLQTATGLGLHLESVDISGMLSALIDEESTDYPLVRFIREIPGRLMVQADPGRLRQLMASLSANARLHGVRDEPILVQLEQQGDTVVLDVSNVGREIPRDVVRAIFEPFLKPRDMARARGDGLGLGLYIARHIARAHGGDLTYAYAEPYVLFSLTLPVSR